MHYAYPLCSLCIFFIISMQHLKLYTKCYTDLEMVCYLCIELIIYMWPLLHQWKTRFNCKVFKYEFDFVFSPFSLNTLRALAYFHYSVQIASIPMPVCKFIFILPFSHFHIFMARVRIYRFTINIVSIGIYMQYIVTNSKIFLCNDMFMVKFDLLLRKAVKYHFL